MFVVIWWTVLDHGAKVGVYRGVTSMKEATQREWILRLLCLYDVAVELSSKIVLTRKTVYKIYGWGVFLQSRAA